MNPLEKAIQVAGGQSELARKCGASQQQISYWLHKAKKRVPAEYVIPIERATGGRVSRHELRPDLYPEETETAA